MFENVDTKGASRTAFVFDSRRVTHLNRDGRRYGGSSFPGLVIKENSSSQVAYQGAGNPERDRVARAWGETC